MAYGVLLSFEPVPGWWRGACVGFVVGALVVSILWMIQLFSGSQNQLYGLLGEKGTAEALLTRRMRRQGWSLVHGLTFERQGNVDHVLVGPGGVFAVESKWTNEPWSTTPRVNPRLDDAMCQARLSARKIMLTLMACHLLEGVTVRAVVVVWGPGAPDLPDGWMEEAGVIVVEGRRAQRWTRSPWPDHLSGTAVDAIAGALRSELADRAGPERHG